MRKVDAARLVLVQVAEQEDPHDGLVADWVASTAWSCAGFRIDEVYPSAWLRARQEPAAIPGVLADAVLRIAGADAVVIVVASCASGRLQGLDALVDAVGEHLRGKPVAFVYSSEHAAMRCDRAIERIRARLAAACLDADVRFPPQGPRSDARGCPQPDSSEAHALRCMFTRLLDRVGVRRGTGALDSCRAVA